MTGGSSSNGASGDTATPAAERVTLRMPAEADTHCATWMAYGATGGAWGDDTTTAFGRDLSNSRTVARQDLMRLAANLSRYEPVFMLVDSAADRAQASSYLDAVVAQTDPKDQFHDELDNSGRIYIGGGTASDLQPIKKYPITFIGQHVNDLWTRDTAPVFTVGSDGVVYGVDLNFNCWGQCPIRTGLSGWRKDPAKTTNGVLDQPIDGDVEVAGAINRYLNAPEVKTWLTMEGGGIEMSGHGLAVACESSIINDNRNPGKSKPQIEAELRRLFGVERVLWMPGIRGEDLTDWHVDFTARFVTRSDLLYAFDPNFEPPDQRNERALTAAVDAINHLSPEDRSRFLGSSTATLATHTLPLPDQTQVYASFNARNALSITDRGLEEFILTTAAGYIGYYEANGCIIMAQYGDSRNDKQAFDSVQRLYPDRAIIQMSCDGITSGGGTIHCSTQQQP